MKKTVLITGANGFIAKHLIPILQKNYRVKLLSRTPKADNEYQWDVSHRILDPRALDDINYIVHLAGSKLNDGTPLTEDRKKLVYDTRIGAADFLREQLQARHQKIECFVSASAIGYYSFSDQTNEIDETGKKGIGFSADLCEDWEKAADKYKRDNVADQVAKIRVAIVLGNDGGIFPAYLKMVAADPMIALRADSSALPWNHVEDMARIFAFAVEHRLDGVYNSVAPEPASIQSVFKAISNQMDKTSYDIAAFKGQHLVSHKIIDAGFDFQYPGIEKAVEQIYKTIL